MIIPKHYPAPPIPDAIPPTIRVLKHLLELTPEDPEILSALGTVYLREQELDLAVSNLRTALKLKPELSKVRTNLGICLSLLGEDVEAESQFREALIHDPGLEIATLQLVDLLFKKSDFENALKMIDRALQNRATIELNVRAGECANALGQIDKAKGYFEKALDEEHPLALSWFAEYDIKRARDTISSGSLIDGIEILSQAYHRAPIVFTGGTRAVALLNEITKLDTEKFIDINVQRSYLELLKKLLRLGVVWEVFVRPEKLEEAEQLWEERIKKRASYPYGQYRLGIIQAFQEKFMESLDSLDLCRAQLPVKKQKIIKLAEVVELIGEVRDACSI